MLYWIAENVGPWAVALLLGIVCGLLPFILGMLRKRPIVAIVGLLAATAGGFVGGIFIAPVVAIVFTVVILVRKKK